MTLSFILEIIQIWKCVDIISADSIQLGLNEYHRLRTGHQATAEAKAPSFQLQGGSVVVANKPVSHKQHLVSSPGNGLEYQYPFTLYNQQYKNITGSMKAAPKISLFLITVIFHDV